ncbi:glycosyltransferase family 2 protein [Seleniivibrio sp.]|uniref:glycosyltransferase family 2 protein n=1 Tax=Seleniivibrio sp. TaxID=2898801 RepID=UPI0025DB506E|nr:glycosyltransferase family 2 protein [Seleniivibrio sp.]MCD8553999.1 glycosyltransferase family 2 protein [Seleniivibrio sp.]
MSSVSVLLATYNGSKFISQQIDSLLSQSFTDFKMYIHDDDSSDETLCILKEYKDERIIILKDGIKCGGAKENFAHLLQFCIGKSDYYMFCDQDDVWLEDKIESTLAKMTESEELFPHVPILVHTDLKVVGSDLSVISDSMIRFQKIKVSNNYNIIKLSLENTVTGCTVMMNHSLAEKLTDMPEEAIVHDWWAGLTALAYGGKVVYLDKATILYRQHERNTIGTQKTDIRYMFSKLKNLRDVFAQFRAAVRQQKRCGIRIPFVFNIILKTYLILRRVFSK